MTAENKQRTHLEVKPPFILSPWLVALAAMVLYGLTLNRWVTFSSLPLTSQITGWDWHPGPLSWRHSPQYHPLTLILTYPLRLLPVGWRVVGLNAFTAVCASLTLVILARSVRLLSHDCSQQKRTLVFYKLFNYLTASMSFNAPEERQVKEGGWLAMLSVRAAFLPAAFAVLLLGAQLTFWENSIVGTGEMINLLVFAFLVLCLLEFRVSASDKWLFWFAFVYGAGVANSWALIGFFPCFLFAFLWLKRVDFFNPDSSVDDRKVKSLVWSNRPTLKRIFRLGRIWLKRIWLFNWKFVIRLVGCGFLGLLLYGLIPLLGVIRHEGGFWELLRQKLAEQHVYFLLIPRYYALIAGLPTLLPLLSAFTGWPALEGEFKLRTETFARVSFRAMQIVFLAVGVLMFFDVAISPSPRVRFGLGVRGEPGFLSFYYLAALSVGYFSGYLLLVFGKDVAYRWGQALTLLRTLNLALVGLLWAAAIVLPGILFYLNFAHIRDYASPAVSDFGKELAQSLPAGPAFVVADDPVRLYLTIGASQSLGLPNQYTFIEGQSLPHGEYFRYLADHDPAFRKELVHPEQIPDKITDQQIGLLLAHLSQQRPVYYLHPSFGEHAEAVCLMPRRLGADVLPAPTNVLTTLVLKPAEITTNQAYWLAQEKGSLAKLPELAKTSVDAMRVAAYYSQLLDYWGTEMQKSATKTKLLGSEREAMLKDAHEQFEQALRLNPGNFMARLNQQFNARLCGAPPAGTLVGSSNVIASFHNRWELALNLYGPADVPDLDVQIGRYFGERGLPVQAAHLFQRCLELDPGHPVGALNLAQAYIDLGLAEASLDLIGKVRGGFKGDKEDLVNVEVLACIAQKNYARADKLLTEEHNKNPKSAKFSSIMAESYRLMGYSVLNEAKGNPAKAQNDKKDAVTWFKKALAALDEFSQLLPASGANALLVYDSSLRKAELQMSVKDYAAAIITLTEMVRHDPDKPVPLLNRAISELQVNRLDEAKNDYLAVEKLLPKPSAKIYRGLAQIAQLQKDKSSEIRYEKEYLKYASEGTPEFTNATEELRQLEGH